MDMWVFGYGSLLWNPGFDAVEAVPGRLRGYHRSFCMLSIHHRGTEDHPGLVLALEADAQASCDGLALRVAAGAQETVLAYLRAREMVSSAYVERHLPLDLHDGRRVTALAYVIDPGHRQYCRFDADRQARMIASARGGRGPNDEYLFNTVAHLDQLGLRDDDLHDLAARVRALRASAADPRTP